MSIKKPRNFWHPPRWKWLVVMGLLILAVAVDLAGNWWNVHRANSVIPPACRYNAKVGRRLSGSYRPDDY